MSRMNQMVTVGLAGLTVAGVKWMFELTEERTMWENRYVLAGAAIMLFAALAYWVKLLWSFTKVGERAHTDRVRRRWWRRRVNRALNRRLKDIV